MPTTSNANMFYVGNFASMDTNEANTFNENPGVVLRTYDNPQLTRVTEIDSNDDGAIHDDEFGTGDYLSYNLGGGVTNSELDSSSIYNAEALLGDGTTTPVQVLVLQTANGDVFITEWSGTPLDNLSVQSISLLSLATSDADGYYADRYSVEGSTVVCYGRGTLIKTPDGHRRVEELQTGQYVSTIDRGAQVIVWRREHEYSFDDARREQKPVLIKRGALGCNRPSRDLIVSPQHRIVVGRSDQLHQLLGHEAFVPAKSLTALPGIRFLNGQSKLSLVHFACAQHEVITANGCLSESLLLGPMVLRELPLLERNRVESLFPLRSQTELSLNGVAARPCLSAKTAKKLVEASLSSKKRKFLEGPCFPENDTAPRYLNSSF